MDTTSVIEPSPEITLLEQPPSQPVHRKIAKLPKPLRDIINSMIADSFPARLIIEKLQASTDPPLPYPISEMNISDWKNTGYLRHLAQQERATLVQSNREGAFEMVGQEDPITLPEATLQIVASQYYEFLGDFSIESLKQKLGEDPLKYTRFLNVFARVTREIVNLKKHREACVQASRAVANTVAVKPDPDRELSDNEYDLVVNKMDQVFKVARKRGSKKPAASADEKKAEPKNPFGSSILYVPNPNGGPARIVDSYQQEVARLEAQKHSLSTGGEGRGEVGQNSPEVAAPSSQPENQNSEIKNHNNGKDGFHSVPNQSTAQNHSLSAGGECRGEVAILSQHSSQNSKIKNLPEEFCPNCKIRLAKRLPNGLRTELSCNNCHTLLPYEVVTGIQPVEFCPRCSRLLQTLLPDGQRPERQCNCGEYLPPPGEAVEKKYDHCTECGCRLPALLPNGERPSPNCPECNKPLHPPVPESDWVSEYCRYCANAIPPNGRIRNRPRENCVICGGPYEPIPNM